MTPTGGVAQRNESYTAWSASDKYFGLMLGAPVYDMSIIVEPNSPIDPETGLPESTIAVATDRAVNIMRLPSGRIIRSAEDSSYDVDEIDRVAFTIKADGTEVNENNIIIAQSSSLSWIGDLNPYKSSFLSDNSLFCCFNSSFSY